MVAPPNFHDSVQLVNLQLVDTNFSRAPYQMLGGGFKYVIHFLLTWGK